MEPGRAQPKACFIEPSVPTHSSTASAPTPSVSSLIALGALLAALGDDVGGPELPGDLLALLVARHRDHPLGAHLGGGQHAAQADGAVADHDDGVAGLHAGGDGAVPAGREHVGEGEQRRAAATASGMPSVLTRLPSAWVTLAYSPCPPVVKPTLTHAEWTPARQFGQVLSQWQNGAITKSPGRERA